MVAALHLNALGPSGEFRSYRTEPVSGIDGAELAQLSVVPELYVNRAIARMRRARPLQAPDRIACLAEAGTLFLHTVDGVPLADYEKQVTASSGVALPVVQAASQSIAHSAGVAEDTVRHARPLGTVGNWHAVSSAGAVWTRRGEVLGVQAPGNHPATHSVWLEALALGYRVAVRPSRREPFTANRLVRALRACGFGADQVAFLPTEHVVARQLVDAADRALVYGGSEVVSAYRDRADVLVQGPGRSKILLADGRPMDHVDMVVDSVAGFGATACMNTSAVLTDGDPAGFARELARRLADIPVVPPSSKEAVLPAFSAERGRSIEAYLRSRLEGGELIPGHELVTPLPGGGVVLRPAVILLKRAQLSQIAIELPFPCVWVAPWSPLDGIEPLRDSLTVTAITDNDELLSSLADEASISNLHIGDQPTHRTQPGLPHDGHLAEFLMRSKTVIRDVTSL